MDAQFTVVPERSGLSTKWNAVGKTTSRRDGAGVDKWFSLIVGIRGMEEYAIEILDTYETGSKGQKTKSDSQWQCYDAWLRQSVKYTQNAAMKYCREPAYQLVIDSDPESLALDSRDWGPRELSVCKNSTCGQLATYFAHWQRTTHSSGSHRERLGR